MSETHSDHKDEHGHDEHHEGDKKHGDTHGSEHGAGHGDAHGGHAEHGAGHGAEHGAGHGGHGGGHGHHGHSEFDQYKHEPRKPPTPEQRAALMRIAAENAKKLRAKNRVGVLRAIEALQKNHDIQQELGPLILQLRIEIFNILEK
jgi:hypothetical protein